MGFFGNGVDFSKILGRANQNVGERVVITDDSIGVSQLLGDVPRLTPSVRLCSLVCLSSIPSRIVKNLFYCGNQLLSSLDRRRIMLNGRHINV